MRTNRIKAVLLGLLIPLLLLPAAAESVPALSKKAAQALDEDQIYDAIELYRSALRQNPDFLDAYIGLAKAFYYLDEYDEALRQVQAGLRLGHDSTDLLNTQGRILLALGKPQDAANIFRLILRKEPYNVDALMGLGQFSLMKGNEAEALASYLASLQYNPHDRRILLSLALLYENKHDAQKAEKYLLKAVDEYPDHPLVQVMAARFYLERGELAQAEFHARTALSLSPDYTQALEVIGQTYLAMGQDAKVVSAMQQLIQLDQDNSRAWYISGVAHLRLGEVLPAIESLQRALEVKPGDETVRLVLEDTAVAHLPETDEIRRTLSAYHFDQAAQFRKKNMNERAEYHFLRAMYLAPQQIDGRIAYAKYLKDSKRKASFVKELEALKSLGATSNFVQDNLEIFKSLLVGTVSDDWQIDQYMQERQPLLMRVYYIPSAQSTEHPLSEAVLARYFQYILAQSAKISFSSGKSELDPASPPQVVASTAEAFNKARSEKTDYYVLMEFKESGQDFAFTAGLYLSRTGKMMEEPRSYRTGNFMVQNSVGAVAAVIQKILPSRGIILKRQLNTVLTNLGSDDGLVKDAQLYVVPGDAYVLNSAQPGFAFEKKDLLGSIKVAKTDERIASGTYVKEGFYDRMNAGDTVLLPGETVASTRDSILSFPYLYNRIRLIH